MDLCTSFRASFDDSTGLLSFPQIKPNEFFSNIDGLNSVTYPVTLTAKIDDSTIDC